MSETDGPRPVKRPRRYPGLFKYYGGKARLAEWIVSNLPPHTCYCEPFCGGARVLFAKPRSRIEVVNDLDRGVTSALRACRDCPDELAHLLSLTPYSRGEFEDAVEAANGQYGDDLVEAARQFLVLVEQGRNAQSKPSRSSWRTQRPTTRSGRAERGWTRVPDVVRDATTRLREVVVECRPAEFVLEFYDGPETLFYLDPPYHPRTCDVSGYQYKLTVEAHEKLAEQLAGIQGMALLSGYRHDDYDKWYAGWRRLDRDHVCGVAAAEGGSSKRVESLWFNPLAWERRTVADENSG